MIFLQQKNWALYMCIEKINSLQKNRTVHVLMQHPFLVVELPTGWGGTTPRLYPRKGRRS